MCCVKWCVPDASDELKEFLLILLFRDVFVVFQTLIFPSLCRKNEEIMLYFHFYFELDVV